MVSVFVKDVRGKDAVESPQRIRFPPVNQPNMKVGDPVDAGGFGGESQGIFVVVGCKDPPSGHPSGDGRKSQSATHFQRGAGPAGFVGQDVLGEHDGSRPKLTPVGHILVGLKAGLHGRTVEKVILIGRTEDINLAPGEDDPPTANRIRTQMADACRVGHDRLSHLL